MKKTQNDRQGAAPSTPTHAQHQLAEQRDTRDAAARASAVRQLDASTAPAKAGTPPKKADKTFAFDVSELRPGELYAGIVSSGGISRHLILLPAEAAEVTWQQAKTFAAAVGGELPDLDDYEVLLQNLKARFSGEDVYWSSEGPLREGLLRESALYLDFSTDPYRDWDLVDSQMRARVVRRIFAGYEQSVVVDWHEHIKTAREAAGVSVGRLAKLIGVTPSAIEQWERGEVRTILGSTLMNVCAVLDVDPGRLLGADDE